MNGEVRLSPDHSGLEILADDPQALAGELRGRVPEIRPRPVRGRLRIEFADGEALTGIGVRWDPDAQQAVANRAHVRRYAAAVRAEAASVRTANRTALRDQLADSQLLDVLDEHQLRNVAVMTIAKGWGACIFDEQGTGKTPTVIAAFDVLVERNEADTLLVVAPKSMVGEWAEEFRRFAGDLYRVAVVGGSRAERAAALAAGADVVVVNYEATITHVADLRLLARRSRVVLAVDESFNVKNPDAARTAAVASLREWCVRCFALCGTPAPNTPHDVVAQVSLVDFGMTFEGLALPGDPERDRSLIQDALRARGLFTRNLKRHVLPGLPGKQFSEVSVEFSPRQRELYAHTLEGLIAELERVDDATYRRQQMSFAAKRSSLLRLCSHPAGVVPDYSETPAKLQALDPLLEGYASAGEKVVLWSFYRATLEILAERYQQYGVARVDGSVADVATRRAAVKRFQDDDETLIFLGNPAAAGAGLTLHRAAVAIYESFSNQAAHFMQSLDRIHRRGQERGVEYLVLLCSGSVEETEYARILSKVGQQADLLGDPDPAFPTREVLLTEFLDSRERLGR